MKKIAITNLILSLVLLLAGCSDQGDPVPVAPGNQVSYASQIQPLFNQNCSCHLVASPPNNMNLTSYAALMAVPPDPNAPTHAPVVIPGLPDSSHLYLRLTGDITPQMPFLQPPLSADNINLIGQWIEEGALNN